MFLSLDIGGHACRAIVFDENGNRVGENTCSISTFYPYEDRVEHDPVELMESLKQSIYQLAEMLGPKICAQVKRAGLATQRSSLVCWNRENGEALSPVISWQDTRAASILTEKLGEWGKGAEGKVRRITGLFANAHYGASKIRWCLDESDAVGAAAKNAKLACAPLSSFLLKNLLIEKPFVVDSVNASRTMLWSLDEMDWSHELLDLFGIDRNFLPHCVKTQYFFGTLDFGGYSLPLTLCTGDQSAAVFGNGKPNSERLLLNVGTGAFVQKVVAKADRGSARLLHSIVHSDQERVEFVLEGTVNGAGSALEWFRHKMGWAEDGFYSDLSRWLEECRDPPVFLNGISGLGSPWWIPGQKSKFLSESSPENQAVAVLESIVFLIVCNIRALHPSCHSTILLSGGISKLAGFRTRLANLSGLAVFLNSEKEATARGIAFLLAGRPKEWGNRGQTLIVKPRPDPPLFTRFESWLRAMPPTLHF